MTDATSAASQLALRFADNALVLGQRLCHWVSRSPTIELDIAIANHGLDLFGQAQLFYEVYGTAEGKGRSADDLAYWRGDSEFTNFHLVEQPNGDFAYDILRQYLYALYADICFRQMVESGHGQLAPIAGKAIKEMDYHVRHAGEWIVRFGDGTDESHGRAQKALEALWPFVAEFFDYDDVDTEMSKAGVMPTAEALGAEFEARATALFDRATLTAPEPNWKPRGGRKGIHSEHLSYLLAELQVLPRQYPDASW